MNADHSSIEVEKCGERSETWDQFKESIPHDNARWAVYDLEFAASDGRKVSKLCFILFGPDSNTDSAEKFSIAANKDTLKSKISEVNRDFQINSWDELDEEVFIKAFGI